MGVKNGIKKIGKKIWSPQQIQTIKKSFSYKNPLIKPIAASWYSDNLNKLAVIHGTDKWDLHWYTQHYAKHFAHLKDKKINLLEIGVGGDDDPLKGGNSLRMWKSYFSRAKIFAIDIVDKSAHEESRIKIFKGDQSDEKFLKYVVNKIGEVDLILDDGSHVNEHVIITFKTLFPLLKKGGIYVIEDTQTSYWEAFGGDNADFNNPRTMLAFFKSLTDSLNYAEFRIPNYVPSYYDLNITEMHFYRNMVIIYK
jgi:hypothetical protein